MRHVKINLPISLVIMVLAMACSRQNHETAVAIDVMTYNIKFDDPNYSINGWDQRKHRVASLLDFYEPDFFGTQEGLLHQLQYLDSVLTDVKWIGVGRNNGSTQGEFSALFFNEKKFELVTGSDSTIWLSESPGVPSKSWDAAFPRILTWGKFKHKSSGRSLYVFNTHFDHVGDTARTESAKIITATISKIVKDYPVILTGDFNVTPEEKPYEILTEEYHLSDTQILAGPKRIGPEFTYSGFEVDPNITPRRIDYIFINDHFKVCKYGVLSDFNSGLYPSDHLPVITNLIFSENQ